MTDLSKQESQRLTDLEKDLERDSSSLIVAEKLTAKDIVLLLQHSSLIKNIILDLLLKSEIVPNKKSKKSSAQSSKLLTETSVISVEDQKLIEELAPTIKILNLIKSDKELFTLCLSEHQDSSNANILITMIAKFAQLHEIESLFDLLKDRCKKELRTITQNERDILEYAISIFNRTFTDKKAELVEIIPEAEYNFKEHDRGTSTGQTIKTCWLPGLRNPAGNIIRKPVVETK